jgi:hypothetical protein
MPEAVQRAEFQIEASITSNTAALTGEYQIQRALGTGQFPFLERSDHRRTQRNIASAGCALERADPTANIGALAYVDHPLRQIDVAPSQTAQFDARMPVNIAVVSNARARPVAPSSNALISALLGITILRRCRCATFTLTPVATFWAHSPRRCASFRIALTLATTFLVNGRERPTLIKSSANASISGVVSRESFFVPSSGWMWCAT